MKRFLRILTPCLAAVPVCYVGSLILAVSMLILQVPVYQSQALIEFPPPAPDATRDSYEIQQGTQIRKLTTENTLSAVRERLNRPASEISSRMRQIEAVPLRDTSLIQLSVDSIDPILSAEFANEWAEAAVVMFKAESQATYQIVQRARPASAPTGPRNSRTLSTAGIRGALLGLVIAVALATIINKVSKKEYANP